MTLGSSDDDDDDDGPLSCTFQTRVSAPGQQNVTAALPPQHAISSCRKHVIYSFV